MPKGYTLIQIILHWVVFLLVALQFVLHDSISAAFRSLMREGTFEPNGLVLQHIVGGVLILALVLWRMAIKAKRGAPPLPENEPAILKLAAHATHLVLYLLLILLPVSGLVAWFGKVGGAAEAHEIMKTILLLLVVLHVAGGLFQQFVLKSDVLKRMGRPET